MKKTCKDCEQRDGCVALCADIESDVNQDYVSPSKQIPLVGNAIYYFSDEDIAWDWQPDKIGPKKLKWLIIELHKQGKNECQITYHLSCSQPYVHRVIRKFLASQVFDGE